VPLTAPRQQARLLPVTQHEA